MVVKVLPMKSHPRCLCGIGDCGKLDGIVSLVGLIHPRIVKCGMKCKFDCCKRNTPERIILQNKWTFSYKLLYVGCCRAAYGQYGKERT